MRRYLIFTILQFCRSSREARNSWQKCRHNDVKAVGICSVPTDRILVTRLPCDCNISAAHFKSSTICQMVLIIAKTYGIFGYPRTEWGGSGIIYSQVSSFITMLFSDVTDPEHTNCNWISYYHFFSILRNQWCQLGPFFHKRKIWKNCAHFWII